MSETLKKELTLDEMIARQEKERRRASRRQFWRVFLGRGALSRACFAFLILFAFAAVFGPLLTPYSPYEQSLAHALEGPSAAHPLGMDGLGRDLLTRTIYGARISFCTGLLSSVIALVAGSILGLIAGYSGGFVSGLIMRSVDAQLSIPGLILTMCLVAIFGGSILSVSVIIGISALPGYVRMLYGQVLSLRENDYVAAAELIGQNKFEIMLKHLLPNAMSPIIISMANAIPGAIFSESFLSYIGLGVPLPMASWGSLASDGANKLLTYPYQLIFPALLICVTMLCFNLMGDGLRDALDPRLKD